MEFRKLRLQLVNNLDLIHWSNLRLTDSCNALSSTTCCQPISTRTADDDSDSTTWKQSSLPKPVQWSTNKLYATWFTTYRSDNAANTAR